MKKFLLTLILLTGNLVFGADVTILHTSDVHGRISPVEYKGVPDRGGFSRRVTFVNDVRSKNKNVLLLDSGDYFQGSLYYRMDLGKSSAKLLPEIKYDAIVLGNHEFDNGVKVLKRNIKLSKTPFLSANVHFKDKYLQKAVKPYIIKEFDGEKFLIIGVTTPDLAKLSASNDFTVTNPVDEIKKIINTVDYDKLIILSHCGNGIDKNISKSIPQIDLILGGHNHLYFDKPEYIQGNPIIQDGEFGMRIGVVDFDKKVKSYTYKYITPEISSNPEIDKKIKNIDKEHQKVSNKVVAKTNTLLIGDQNTIEKTQTNLGKIVLLSMTRPFEKDFDGVVTNSGSIRINRNLKGDITYADILEILPFDNDIVMVEIQGKDLKGIFDTNKHSGRRYVQYYLKDKNIEDSKTYKIITNNYMAQAKDGYEEFKNSKVIKRITTKPTKLLQETMQELNVINDDKIKF